MLAAHEIFGFMSPALAADIIDQIYANDRDTYRSILASVAESRKVRPVFFERKAKADRHKDMAESLTRPRLEAAAITTLQSYLLKCQAPMLGDFLDALGIKHDNGVVDELPQSPDDARLTAAVDAILAKYPHERVAVYLRAFNDLSQAGWPKLSEMLDQDPRLQLGS